MAESPDTSTQPEASPPPQPPHAPRRGGVLRRALLLLVVMLALAAGAVLIFPDRLLVPWLLPAAQSLAREHGWQLTVESLEGNVSRRLDLRGVRLRSVDPGLPDVELAVDRAEVIWSPWRVLTGAPAPVREVRLFGGTLRADLTRGTPGTGPAPTPAELAGLLDELPPLTVDLLGVELRAPSHGWLDTPVLTAHATLRADGSTLVLEEGGLDGDGPEGRLPAGAVLRAPAVVDLTHLPEGELPFSAEVGVAGGAVAVHGVLGAHDVRVRFTALGLQLASLWQAVQGGSAPGLVDGPLLLDGTLRIPLDGRQATSAEANFTLGSTRVRDFQVDAAVGLVSLADGALAFRDVQITQDNNLLVVESLALPLEAVSARAAAAAPGAPADGLAPWSALAPLLRELDLRARADLADLPALLAALRDAGWLPAPPALAAAPEPGAEPGAPAAPATPREDLASALERQVGQAPHRLTLQMQLEGGRLQLHDGLLQTAGGTLALERGAFDLLAPDPRDAALDVQLAADFADLAPLGPLVGPLLQPLLAPGAAASTWAGTLSSRAHVTGSLRAPVAALEIVGNDLVAAGWQLGKVRAHADVDAEELRVRDLTVEVAGASLSASGACALRTRTLRDVRLDAELRDPDWLPLAGVAGTLQAHAELSGPLRAPLGSVTLAGRDLLWAGAALDGVELRATHAPGLLAVEAFSLSTPYGSVSASGTAALDESRALHDAVAALQDVRLETLTLERDALSFALAAPAELRRVDGRWSGGPLELAGGAGRLVVTLGSAPAADGSGAVQTLNLVAQGLQPLFLLPDGAGMDALDADLTASLGPGSLSARGRVEARGLLVQTERSTLRGDVTAWLTLGGTLQAPRGEVELAARGLLVDVPGRLAPPGFGPCTLDGHLTFAERVTVDWLHIDSPHQVHLDATGALDLPPDLGARYAAAVATPGLSRTAAAAEALNAALADAPLELAVSASAGRLEALSALLLDVRRMDGELGAELAVGGTYGQPTLRGAIVVRHGELRLASGFPPLDALEARLELSGTTLSVAALTGELGSAPFSVSGTAELGPGGAGLDLAFRGEDLLLYRNEGVTVRADADVTVRGPHDALVAGGTLTLRDSGVVSSLNLLHFAQGGGRTGSRGLQLFSFQDPPLSTLALDLHVTAAEPFAIRNSIVRGGLRPDLRLTGTGRTPILDGNLFVEPSRVSLPSGSVTVDGGRVIFSAADPFRPQLDLQASARRRGYEVSIQVSGPYDQPVVSMTSVPPLASDRILMLVLTGQSPGRGAVGPAGTDTTTHTVAVYLGQDLLARWSGDDRLDEEGLMDRIAVDVVKDVSTTNSDLLQVSYRLSEVPRAGGQITYLRAEKDIYDRINFGVQFLFRLE